MVFINYFFEFSFQGYSIVLVYTKKQDVSEIFVEFDSNWTLQSLFTTFHIFY